MTNLFAVMAEPRRPWLNPDELKARFLQLSAQLHPDRVQGSSPDAAKAAQRQFTELSTAYRCLQDPHQRLKHLLELETGATPAQVNEIPPALMDAFMEVGTLCRQSDALAAKKSSTASPLLQVEIFAQAQQSIERLTHVHRAIALRRDALLGELEQLDSRWIENQHRGLNQPQDLLCALADVYRLLGYLQRWQSQLQERILQLAL